MAVPPLNTLRNPAASFDASSSPLKARGLQSLTPRIVRYLEKLDLQHVSKFDFLLFRDPTEQFSSSGGLDVAKFAVTNLVGLPLDMLVAKIYVSKISFAPTKVEYERVNGDYYPKEVVYPDSVQLTFIEDEKGLVARYLADWMDDIAFPTSAFDARQGHTFRDNQDFAKRTGILLLANKQGNIPTFPRITFFGLCPKGPDNIEVDMSKGDNLTYTVDFACRDVRISRFI